MKTHKLYSNKQCFTGDYEHVKKVQHNYYPLLKKIKKIRGYTTTCSQNSYKLVTNAMKIKQNKQDLKVYFCV